MQHIYGENCTNNTFSPSTTYVLQECVCVYTSKPIFAFIQFPLSTAPPARTRNGYVGVCGTLNEQSVLSHGFWGFCMCVCVCVCGIFLLGSIRLCI